ncbi:MAG: LLM class flavin-dependent oxidoreductase [Chloroflexi bacterium]|nr:LLM class flavin-dependent oxidoreductase [Chloroflexota bacterium]
MAPPKRLNFGIFMAPFHIAGDNPTLSLQRDLELIEWLDVLGYDEAWIGEHHSLGWEMIASPEIFIATAAERTKHIRLGTGVVSIPYHHPFHVADRLVLLDHLTHGRVMLGVGPGALATDAYMLGIPAVLQRERMNEGLGIIIRLMTEEEPITYKSDWFELNDAQLQLKPYQRPTMPIAIASTLTPSGVTSAGKHGAGVLSMASYAEHGMRAMKDQWTIWNEAAKEAGKPAPDRATWRIVMPFHLADSTEEAIRDIEDGVLAWNQYLSDVLGSPANPSSTSGREVAERLRAYGALIGTPDEAVAGIAKIQEMSGGFGCLLGFAHEWASREKTLRSYELMARYVMPQVQDTVAWIDRSLQYNEDNKDKLMSGAKAAIDKAMAQRSDDKPK